MSALEEIAGMPFAEFEDSIYRGLNWYQISSSKSVVLDGIEEAAKLKPAPGKPYSAKSELLVAHKDGPNFVEVGSMAIMAFAPFDGTGKEGDFALEDIDTGNYPRDAKVVPRRKDGVAAELHLSISSHDVDNSCHDPVLHSGNLDLLGFRPDQPSRLVKISELGESERDFRFHFGGNFSTTYTTGYRNLLGSPAPHGERFGDPHAAYNSWEDRVQIAGFLALTPEMAAVHFEVFDALWKYGLR